MAKDFFASTKVQFWLGTVVGGAVTSLLGGAIAFGMIPSEACTKAAGDYAAEVIKTPARDLAEASERKVKLARLRQSCFSVDFGSVLKSAVALNDQELDKFTKDKDAADKKAKREAQERGRLAKIAEAEAAASAVEAARRLEQQRQAEADAQRKKEAADLAAERARAERFDLMLQKSKAR